MNIINGWVRSIRLARTMFYSLICLLLFVREFRKFINIKLSDDVVYGVLNNLRACISELLARQYILNEFGDDVVIRYEPSFLSPCDAMFKFMLPLDESVRRAACERFKVKLFDKTNILLPEGVNLSEVAHEPSLVFNLRLSSTWDLISTCPLIEAKLRQDLGHRGSISTDYVDCFFNSDTMTCILRRHSVLSLIKHAKTFRVDTDDFIDLVNELLCLQACVGDNVDVQKFVDFLVVKVDGEEISGVYLIEAKSITNPDEEYKVRKSLRVYRECFRKCFKRHRYAFEVINAPINMPREARLEITRVTGG